MTKEEKRISVEKLRGCDSIVAMGMRWYRCDDAMVSFGNLPCVLSTYLIESLISPSCSYEYYVVYVQWKKYCYTTTTYEVHTIKNKVREIIKIHFFVITFFCLFIPSWKFLIIKTCDNEIAHIGNAI